MKLVNPGVGDILDRLSILSLKILHGEQAEREVAHFTREVECLLGKIVLRRIPTAETISITAVNAMLWQAEDQIREFRKLLETPFEGAAAAFPFEAIARTAFRVQALNDQRNSIIEAINKAAGDHTGCEKEPR